jgi:hypothetical protein
MQNETLVGQRANRRQAFIFSPNMKPFLAAVLAKACIPIIRLEAMDRSVTAQ